MRRSEMSGWVSEQASLQAGNGQGVEEALGGRLCVVSPPMISGQCQSLLGMPFR